MELKGAVSLETTDTFLLAQVNLLRRKKKNSPRWEGDISPARCPPTQLPARHQPSHGSPHQPSHGSPHTNKAQWPGACRPASDGGRGLTETCPGDPASRQRLFPCGMISALTILFLPPPESSLLLPCNTSPLAQITYRSGTAALTGVCRWLTPRRHSCPRGGQAQARVGCPALGRFPPHRLPGCWRGRQQQGNAEATLLRGRGEKYREGRFSL